VAFVFPGVVRGAGDDPVDRQQGGVRMTNSFMRIVFIASAGDGARADRVSTASRMQRWTVAIPMPNPAARL